MSGTTVTWTSSADSAVTVGGAGLARAVGNGEATITASAGEAASGTAAITVRQVPSTVAVSPAADTLVAGDTLRLAAEAFDANGHAVTGAAFAWSSGDPAVATVDTAGLVTAAGPGRTAVTAASGSASGHMELLVVARTPAAIDVMPDTVALAAVGDTVRLSARVVDQLGRVLEDEPVSWSSGDEAVITVDSGGLVTAAGEGTTRVTAMAGDVFTEAAVSVMQVVDSVFVSPAADTLVAGDTLRLAAEAFDANGHAVTGAAFAWSSGDPAVATVDTAGLVTATGPGRAAVTAASGSASGHMELLVVARTPAAIDVMPDTATLTALGDTVRLTAEVRDQNGRPMSGTTVTWTSSAEAIVAVDARGLARAVDNGEATITASAGALASATAVIAVAQVASVVTVSPRADTLVAGDALRLEAEAADANGHEVEAAEFSWSSSDPAVVTVDSAGLATAANPGEAEITATSRGATGSMHLLVVAPVPTAMDLTPDTVALTALGDTVRLVAVVLDALGRLLEDAPVSWATSDGTVASVDDAGLVSAQGVGSTRVTAAAGTVSRSAAVLVSQSVGSVVVSPASASIPPGGTLRLTAAAFDANGHTVPVEFSWSSSNTNVATVDGMGVVQAVGDGVATITGRSGDGAGTSQVSVGNSDHAVLKALYEGTQGPDWSQNNNWLTDAPLAEWHGVDVDAEGRVIQLVLRSNNLNGPIPPELGSLTYVQSINLNNNSLTGSIPPELGSLGNLKRLDLLRNGLTGSIPPQLGELAKLESIRLSENELAGTIPPQLGNLSRLEVLSLDRNQLAGTIPPELANLGRLKRLSLIVNRLTGTIPRELGELPELRSLLLAANGLTGTIPPELGKLSALEDLSLNQNALTGSIPPELGKLSKLRSFESQLNQLTGPIPPELGHLVELWRLDFSWNPLEGPLPRSLLAITGLDLFRFDQTAGVCAPGTSAFTGWLENIETTFVRFCNGSDRAVLPWLFETAGGETWTRSTGWLGDGALEEWYGVQTDSLGRVQALDLGRNGLSGRLPANLAELGQLAVLRVDGNALSGPVPRSLTRLRLRDFRYDGSSLCIPDDDAFRTWLAEITLHQGSGETCPSLSDREILTTIYDATGGPAWSTRSGWLTDAPLDEWHGVGVDEAGHVESISLVRNNLTGSLPPEIGGLTGLASLSIRNNRLAGPIPPEIGNLVNLRQLDAAGNRLSGMLPTELGNLARLNSLTLSSNALNGPIPTGLGRLADLNDLNLGNNQLMGRLPPELGRLTGLTTLRLWGNRFTGPIPTELGRLADLEILSLHSNMLTGPIPAEVGDLENLQEVWLYSNGLSGGIPPRIGNLSDLQELFLQDNELEGAVPREVGRLAALRDLDLSDNRLTGSIPPEFGRLTRLRDLRLSDNGSLIGALPPSLTALTRLDALLASGTDLCAPSDGDFQRWLAGVVKQRVQTCSHGERLSIAYLTQAVQSPTFPVPLVADEPAQLRVFVTAPRPTSERIPSVRATFYLNGSETHAAEIPAQTAFLPTEMHEGELALSANSEVPAEIMRPGLEMVVEIDPEGAVDARLDIARRIPAKGRRAVDVREMPPLNLTLIPFLWSDAPDSTIVQFVREMEEDPQGHELLVKTRRLLPVGGLNVTAHEPVVSATNDPVDLLYETEAIRVLEGGGGHYMGMNSRLDTQGLRGVAFVTGRASFSRPIARTMAHELGHNMSLRHAPCGNPRQVDDDYPHDAGSIGAWGYDLREGGHLVPPERADLMSYCLPEWISDYHFAKALRYRLLDEGPAAADADAGASRSLLLWGGVDIEGQPFLEPSFIVDAPATLPAPGGAEFEFVGRTAAGQALFSLEFDMPEVADAEGRTSFAFALPVEESWVGNIASITLSGPGGTATLDTETDRPMVILRNPRNGQVRAFLRDPPRAALARGRVDVGALSPERGLEALFSRGLPDPREWRR